MRPARARKGVARRLPRRTIEHRLDGDLRVEGATTHAVISENGKPQRLPPEFREAALAKHAGPAWD